MILRRKADNFHFTTIGLYAVILKAWISEVIWNLEFVINAYVGVHSQGVLCGICVSRSDVGTLFFESPISAVPCHYYFTNNPYSSFPIHPPPTLCNFEIRQRRFMKS
jgi:hypothetical protein